MPRTAALAAIAVTCLIGAALTGCDQGGNRKILDKGKSPGEYMVIAVSDPDPDVRREAVGRVAASRQASADWAVDGFVTIALLDSDTQARCVSVRGLEQGGHARAVETFLKLLNASNYPQNEVKPVPPVLRGDAALALARFAENGNIGDGDKPAARDTFLARLSGDSDRHVRIAAARGLANFSGDETLKALIQGLRDSDFAVIHRCEESLVKLTGVSHQCNAGEWERWYEENRGEPFARAGETPDNRKPPYDNAVGKGWYKTKRFWRTIFPPKKGE